MKARVIKTVAAWTVWMAVVSYFVDAIYQPGSEHRLQAVVIGAASGLIVGLILTRNQKTNRPTALK